MNLFFWFSKAIITSRYFNNELKLSEAKIQLTEISTPRHVISIHHIWKWKRWWEGQKFETGSSIAISVGYYTDNVVICPPKVTWSILLNLRSYGYTITMNTELVSTEPLNMGRGSCGPLVTAFSLTNQYITLLYCVFVKGTLFSTHCWFVNT